MKYHVYKDHSYRLVLLADVLRAEWTEDRMRLFYDMAQVYHEPIGTMDIGCDGFDLGAQDPRSNGCDILRIEIEP